ncbi:M56 family metallopeptidase [Vallitalea guaymasensis]|uniref:M56 family metallopeptidase n=1 Tax=Vallitalea guaymasensis TaxID=1185412 RepID=A0A8J8MBM7_9FIRM|nr:M56 family metallopeptidase [Vallitalea guaymasensis]QUH29972.1 M56 family metallopeptidase [Vallitalea guaymasensis]
MEYFMTALITSSITMSAISLLYMAFDPLLAKKYSARSIYFGWLIIIIGLLIPFRPQFSNPLIEINPPTASYTNTPIVNSDIDFTTSIIVEDTNSISMNSPQIHWFQVAFILWLAGCALCMTYYILRHIHFMRMINRWNKEVESTSILDLLEELKVNMNINHRVNIKICPCISTPMLVGFYKPVILLPENKMSYSEISLVLRHELVHYKQKDILFKGIMLMVIGIHWFNPMVYFIVKITNRQCELSCDERVTKYLDIKGRKLYAETIINASRRQTRYQTALSTNFYGGKSSMKKRIISIMNGTKKKLGFLILGIIIIATITTGEVLATSNFKEQVNEENNIITEQIEVKSPEQDEFEDKRIEKIKQDSAIYEKFGLTYNEDEDKFYYNNKTVKCFFDKLSDEKNYYFIIRPSGELNLKALRNKNNELIGITLVSKHEVEKIFGSTESNQIPVPKQEDKSISDNIVEENKDNKPTDKIANEYSLYEKYGLTYEKDEDMFYYDGKTVKSFFDKKDDNSYFLFTRPNGLVNIKAIRNEANYLVGIIKVSKKEYDNLFNQ